MRKDQIDRLNDLAEQIGEVFLEEADPATWSGVGLPPADMDKDTRGGRYWDKKNAIQTGTLLARVLDLAERDGNNKSNPLDEDDAEGEIDKYEKKAKDLLRDIQSRSKST
jgi:hypothetical protein